MIGGAVSEETRAQETGEEAVSAETGAQIIEEAVSAEARAQERCTRQFVLIARMNVKFHSSHQETNLFTAETVLETTRSSRLMIF